MLVWVWTFIEVAVTVADARPSLPLSSDIISTFVRSNNPAAAASRIRVTLPFFVGWLFADIWWPHPIVFLSGIGQAIHL
jgi:hypothetical protein